MLVYLIQPNLLNVVQKDLFTCLQSVKGNLGHSQIRSNHQGQGQVITSHLHSYL